MILNLKKSLFLTIGLSILASIGGQIISLKILDFHKFFVLTGMILTSIIIGSVIGTFSLKSIRNWMKLGVIIFNFIVMFLTTFLLTSTNLKEAITFSLTYGIIETFFVLVTAIIFQSLSKKWFETSEILEENVSINT